MWSPGLILGLLALGCMVLSNPIPLPADARTSLTPNARFTRSCSNGMHLLLLGACNKNHKRSPIIMSLIYVEYYVPPDINSNHVGGPSPDLLSDQPDLSGDVWTAIRDSERAFLESIREVYAESLKLEQRVGEVDWSVPGHSASPTLLQHRERQKRVPGIGASTQAVMEKCCSPGGCGETDFLNLCF